MIDFRMRLGFMASAPAVAQTVRIGHPRGVAVPAAVAARPVPASNA